MQDDDYDDTEAGDGSLDMFMPVPIRVIAIRADNANPPTPLLDIANQG